jgi:LmbE family N-acetylglucosaminyl deacetylase
MLRPKSKKSLIIIGAISFAVILGIFYSVFTYLTSRAIIKQAAALHEIEAMPIPATGQKVLVFAPHQDDETLGCGGYIATAVQNGAKVKIVLVTDGNKRKLKNFRYQEFKTATAKLGVPDSDLMFLNYQDSSLQRQDQNQLKAKFTEVIDSEKPDVIISPHFRDAHPDHATVGRLIGGIAKEKKLALYEYVVHYRRFPQNKGFEPNNYLVPPLGLSGESDWKSLSLPLGVEKKKSEALSAYRTQIATPTLRSLFLSMVRRNELYWRAN